MGMDVCGKNPGNEVGKYFRANVWYWHPLWSYCCYLAPAICNKVNNSNSGDGLNDEESKQLAVKLIVELETGRTLANEKEYYEILATLPKEKCSICGGTGKRAEPPNVGPGKMDCNGCNATGMMEPHEKMYHFSTDLVKEFALFLEHCGGFEIW